MKTVRQTGVALCAAGLTLAVAQATDFTRTSPAGGALPANITDIGGTVTDMVGLNGTRITGQLAAGQMFEGVYAGTPLTIGIQTGYTPAMLAALGGGIQAMSVRLTLWDGDTGPGEFDHGQISLLVNGQTVGNFSDVPTQATSPDGLTALSTNAAGGFRNQSLDTGFFVISPLYLAAIFTAVLGNGQMVFQLQGTDPYDMNYYNFTEGLSSNLINAGVSPQSTNEPGPGPKPKPQVAPAKPKPGGRTYVDGAAIASVLYSGLPMALAEREIMLGVAEGTTRDLNARLFRARAAGANDRAGEAEKVGEAPLSERCRIFAAGDYNRQESDRIRDMAGYTTEMSAGSGGVEYFAGERCNVGLAATVFDGATDLAGELGRIETEGVALSPYATFFSGPWHADVLYSYGHFDNDTRRDTGTGRTAEASPGSRSHTVELDAGYNLYVHDLVVGPLAGLEYRTGTIDAYDEHNGGSAALRVDEQTWDSLLTHLGAQATVLMKIADRPVVPQLRLSWDRENRDNSEDVRVSLQESPVLYVADGKSTPGQPFSATLKSAPLQSDYLNAGFGVMIGLSRRWTVLVDYEGHYFRGDSSAHFASLKVCLDL